MSDSSICQPRHGNCRVHLPRLLADVALATILWALSAVMADAWAQNPQLEAIEAKRKQIEQIIAAVDTAAEHRRDGLRFRADTLAGELGTMMLNYQVDAPATIESDANKSDLDESGADPTPEDAADHPDARFAAHLAWLKSFLVDRFQDLQQRIRDERQRFDEFEDSFVAGISRAFQQELRNTSASHIDLQVRLLELSDRIGEVDEALRNRLKDTLTVSAEAVSGQVLLNATTLKELRSMLRADPGNTELARAERAMERKQVQNIDSLGLLVSLMNRLDLNTGSYRALLLSERGMIGVDILNREVFFNLLEKRLETARASLWTEGPNIVFKFVVALSILLITYLLSRLVRRIVTALVTRESVTMHRLMENMLISLSFAVVFAIGFVIALSTIGISLMPMLAGLGVAGIVIGFALQDTLSNFASGWMILIYRPYDIDDHVIAGGAEGSVKKMNLVSTTIATFDNQRLVIPNSRIWGDVITNLTANQTRRVSIPVNIAYGEDLDRVERILREEAAGQEGVLRKPAPNVFVNSIGHSEVVMMVHAWVRTPDFWPLLRSLTKRIKQRLDQEGVEIPLPKQDIYVRALPDALTGKGVAEVPTPAKVDPLG